MNRRGFLKKYGLIPFVGGLVNTGLSEAKQDYFEGRPKIFNGRSMGEIRVIFSQTTKFFTKGVIYKAKRIFKQWPWILMAWDNFDIGRTIHQGFCGEYKLIEPQENRK